MRTTLPAALAILAVVLCGAVHGYWTGRWHDNAGGAAASAERLETVALELGDWQGQTMELKPPAAGIYAQMYRRYVHRSSGETVTVFLVCGQAGPVSIHEPTACYAAAGYKIGTPGKYNPPADGLPAPAEFRTARMLKERSAEKTCLRIFWAWSATGAWQAPDDPRLPFARQPVLYKLYVIRELARPDEALDGDPCIDLMRQLLPELQRSLFAGG